MGGRQCEWDSVQGENNQSLLETGELQQQNEPEDTPPTQNEQEQKVESEAALKGATPP